MSLAFYNARIFTGEQLLQQQALLIEQGRIAGIIPQSSIPPQYKLVDLQGQLLAPALIDLQLYGGNGKLFSMYPSVEALEATYQACLQGGTAYFQPTVATNSKAVMRAAIEAVKQYWDKGGQGVLGLHLEGPYIHPEKRGAHAPDFIHPPTLQEVQELMTLGTGVVSMMTMAPELCKDEVRELLLQNGVILSAGHSNATYEEAMQGFARGFTTVTHLFNAMSPLQGRAPGLVGAAYDSNAYASIIPDGFHVDFNVIRISHRIMGERLFLITDAVVENKEGAYIYLEEEGRYVTDRGILAGSAITLLQGVKNCVEKAGIPVEEALRMATLYPARAIQKAILGSLQTGRTADLIVLDDLLQLRQIIIQGEVQTGIV